ncbi:hypothetical protein IKG45_01965 [Candidatus Saccharibacteria bacterium]|nr:hypothetical protein [Candidatus Saccharibacteria bacterium]
MSGEGFPSTGRQEIEGQITFEELEEERNNPRNQAIEKIKSAKELGDLNNMVEELNAQFGDDKELEAIFNKRREVIKNRDKFIWDISFYKSEESLRKGVNAALANPDYTDSDKKMIIERAEHKLDYERENQAREEARQASAVVASQEESDSHVTGRTEELGAAINANANVADGEDADSASSTEELKRQLEITGKAMAQAKKDGNFALEAQYRSDYSKIVEALNANANVADGEDADSASSKGGDDENGKNHNTGEKAVAREQEFLKEINGIREEINDILKQMEELKKELERLEELKKKLEGFAIDNAPEEGGNKDASAEEEKTSGNKVGEDDVAMGESENSAEATPGSFAERIRLAKDSKELYDIAKEIEQEGQSEEDFGSLFEKRRSRLKARDHVIKRISETNEPEELDKIAKGTKDNDGEEKWYNDDDIVMILGAIEKRRAEIKEGGVSGEGDTGSASGGEDEVVVDGTVDDGVEVNGKPENNKEAGGNKSEKSAERSKMNIEEYISTFRIDDGDTFEKALKKFEELYHGENDIWEEDKWQEAVAKLRESFEKRSAELERTVWGQRRQGVIDSLRAFLDDESGENVGEDSEKTGDESGEKKINEMDGYKDQINAIRYEDRDHLKKIEDEIKEVTANGGLNEDEAEELYKIIEKKKKMLEDYSALMEKIRNEGSDALLDAYWEDLAKEDGSHYGSEELFNLRNAIEERRAELDTLGEENVGKENDENKSDSEFGDRYKNGVPLEIAIEHITSSYEFARRVELEEEKGVDFYIQAMEKAYPHSQDLEGSKQKLKNRFILKFGEDYLSEEVGYQSEKDYHRSKKYFVQLFMNARHEKGGSIIKAIDELDADDLDGVSIDTLRDSLEYYYYLAHGGTIRVYKGKEARGESAYSLKGYEDEMRKRIQAYAIEKYNMLGLDYSGKKKPEKAEKMSLKKRFARKIRGLEIRYRGE